jgi:tyrosyl-tRNA synthetase
MADILKTLRERDLLVEVSDPELEAKTSREKIAVYCGIDPTADSMHLGHLLPVIVMRWWQLAGHQPVWIVGGATGRIGDPGGKSAERPLLSLEEIERNVRGLDGQLRRLMPADHKLQPVIMTNNVDWFGSMGMLEFLRDIGKHFRLGTMLAKDSVKNRLHSDEGISFTEFSYQILQAYDFLFLHRHHQVQVQIGGTEQWGNITAGIELTRKLDGDTVYGTTFPLLLRSDGKKFGKSEGGAIWLDRNRLSPYEFYQYLLRIPDADVILFLKRLTFLPLPQIDQMAQAMQAADYQPFTAQKLLAAEVTRFVHGEEGLQEALRITQEAAPGGETSLDEETLEGLARSLGATQMLEQELIGKRIVDLLVDCQLSASKGEARRLIGNGGVSLNNIKIDQVDRCLEPGDLVASRFVLLAVGKRKKAIVEKLIAS